MIEVTILLPDDSFASTAVGPMEVFRHAGALWNTFSGLPARARFHVTTASADGKAVACDGPLHIQPAAALGEVRKADLIFVPSTGPNLEDAAQRNAAALPWLRRWHRRGTAIAGVCSGVDLLAASGLLDGKRATTHWGLAQQLKAKYPRVRWQPEYMITEDRGIYCGGGVHAALDLSLYLVEKFCGHDVAVQCAKALVVETPRTWQAGFAILPLRTEHHDEAIHRAQEWIHENYRKDFPLEELARRVGMSLRNFVRRFREATGDPPLAYLQKVRIAAAKRLLENRHRNVQEISQAVGYEDISFFRDLFKRHAGVGPQAYRDQFGL